MEDIINAIATDASASEVSDAIKNTIFAKAAEKIDALRPGVAASMFDASEDEVDSEIEAEAETEITDTPEEE
tara:strand:+ start:421 stop:636 length:216 start_codon:yes stop_codon:yes gene_type:complete